MGDQELLPRTMTIAEVRNGLDALVAQISRHGTRVVVEEAGMPVAAIVSTADLRQLAQLDAERNQNRELLARLRAPFAAEPPEEIEDEVARLIWEVRSEMASEQHTASAGR